MNFLEFLPYHNRLIKFRYKEETLEGIVIDEIPYKSKKKESEFLYISRKHLKRWKEADNKGDQISKEKLQEIVDIEEIKDISEKLSDELEKINNKIFDGIFLNLPLEYNFKKNESVSFFRFFNEKLAEFRYLINKIQISKQHFDDIKIIHENIEAVRKCITYYHDGKPSLAYSEIDKILSTKTYQSLRVKKEKKGIPFYRIRVEDSRRNFEQLELFHMPFERRNEITTKRYSIPGFPCLYLSNSIYLAWEELDRPKADEIHVILFKNNRDISYIDLTFDVYNDYEKFNKIEIKEQLEVLALWPLIAACAVKVCNKDDVFKPEYIVPQLVLQWVRQDQKVDAIKYSTTRVDLTKNKGIFHNMVLPVKEIKDEGHCNELDKIFKYSSVVSFELLKLFDYQEVSDCPEKYNVEEIQLIEGAPIIYKLFTLFSKVEKHLMYLLDKESV